MSRVPKFFHFVFGLRPQTEPFHLAHYLCLASCIAVNKPDKVFFHYQNMPYGVWWDKIKPHLELCQVERNSFIDAYAYQNKNIEQYRYAHLADIVRLEVLLKYGGVYADMDTLFVNELPGHFFEQPCVMGKEKVNWQEEGARQAGGSLCNAWIMAEKDSEFVRLWLERTFQEFDGSWSAHSTFLPYKLSAEHPELVHVEPERSFFFFDWSRQGIQAIFEQQTEDLSGVYSIHLWSHLWWSPLRNDFTYFNHKRLTPAYVAYANTTFSHVSRRFLPAETETNQEQFRQAKVKERFENMFILLQHRITRLLK